MEKKNPKKPKKRHNMEKYNYAMALLSLCTCTRSATHNMIKTHMTHAQENTNSTHDLLNMKKMHHLIFDLSLFVKELHIYW